MKLQLPDRVLDLRQPQVMGVLNLTPDSFSDGGRWATIDAALAQARRMTEEGATILDIGGESTRPGAAVVGEQEEIDRVLPVIERLRSELDVVISVDTRKPAVMDAACAAGAAIINDVGALQADGAIAVAIRHRAAVCLMHMRGEPRTMQQAPVYEDVTADVAAFLRVRVDSCVAAGIAAEAIAVDPGFGFGKTLAHNLRLMATLESFAALGHPLLVGVSRKAMLGAIDALPVDARLHPGLAAAALAVWHGASILRTHDVKATVEAARFAAAVRDAR